MHSWVGRANLVFAHAAIPARRSIRLAGFSHIGDRHCLTARRSRRKRARGKAAGALFRVGPHQSLAARCCMMAEIATAITAKRGANPLRKLN